uniref:IST1-like protein n=1 Tax=Setaria italica TaxID=4555 RepID=K3Y246_SETIT
MFDSLLNSKFYNKCKYAFKCIRTRMAPIRRKKHAMIRFLKKDVADLLANGLDTHAFGRMDGLIVELNHASCYDMIEEFCDSIGKQLGSLQKQRECPPETREAVSTLIFAAARFPDLPELCDLRHIFTERYGNFVDPFVSLEDMLEKGSRNPAELAMPLSNKQKCGEDAPYGKQDKDMLENGSIKPAELPMPLSNKQKGNEDAPCERQNKNMLEKGSRKQAEQTIPSSNKQKCNEDVPYGRQDEDMLENGSIKPAELATPLSNKQKGKGDAPCERKHGAKPACRTEKVEIQLNRKDIHAVADGISLIDENSRKQQSDKSGEKEHLLKSVSPIDTNRRNTQKDVKKLNRRDGRPSEKELMEAVELDLNGLPKKGFGAVKFPETESNITVHLNARSKEAVKENCVEKEHEEAVRHHHLSRPAGPDLSRKHADPVLRAQRPENQGCPVSPLNGNRNKGPPYAKTNGANLKNPSEKQANNGLLYDKPQHFTDLGNVVPKGQGVTGRATTMRPPYVKPKSNMQPVNCDPEKQTPSDCSKHISGQIDHMDNKDVLRPVSVRRRTAKPPAPVNAYGEAPNQTPSSHRSHSSRQTGAEYDHNPNGNGTADERTTSSRPKHTGRKNGALNHNCDYDRFMQRRQPEADDSAIDFGNLLPRNANGQRRHKSRGHGDLDEEERMMDKLLIHYSKKGLDPTNKSDNDKEAQIDSQQKISLHPPGRAISLPPEPIGPGEEVKIPARSTSLQPDGPRGVRVHPKMPDFDELAARVNALRKA